MRAPLLSLLMLVAALPLAAPADAATYQVTAMDLFWTPAELNIDPGDTVEFLLGQGTHNWRRNDLSDACELPCARTFTVEESVGFHCGIHPGMTGVINVGEVPAVEIQSPLFGDTVSGVITVTGAASHPTSDIAGVTVRLGNAPAVTATLVGSGTSVTWSAQVPTTNVPNGVHLLTARATTVGGVAGSDSISIQVDNPAFVDLVLFSAGAQQNAVRNNVISFSVRNAGNVGSNAVLVLAEYHYRGTWRAIGTASLPPIAAGSFGASSIVWSSPTHVGAFEVRVTVDPNAVAPDPDRSNNARTIVAGWVTNAVQGVVLTEP